MCEPSNFLQSTSYCHHLLHLGVLLLTTVTTANNEWALTVGQPLFKHLSCVKSFNSHNKVVSTIIILFLKEETKVQDVKHLYKVTQLERAAKQPDTRAPAIAEVYQPPLACCLEVMSYIPKQLASSLRAQSAATTSQRPPRQLAGILPTTGLPSTCNNWLADK